MSKVFAKRNSNTVAPQPQIRVAKSAYRKILLKRIFTILGYAAVAVFAIYLCFASTIMRVVPTISGAGLVPVKENTYKGGDIPSGETILASTTDEPGDEYLDKLGQAFIPSKNAVVVEVIAGPYASMQWMETGLVTVDGSLTEVFLPEQPLVDDGSAKQHLKSEYLVNCISGDCTPGEGLILPTSSIYGLTISDYGVTEKSETSAKGDS